MKYQSQVQYNEAIYCLLVLKTILSTSFNFIPCMAVKILRGQSPLHTMYVKRLFPLHTMYVKRQSPLHTMYVKRQSPLHTMYVKRQSPLHTMYVKRQSPLHTMYVKRQSPLHTMYVKRTPKVTYYRVVFRTLSNIQDRAFCKNSHKTFSC